MAGLRAWAPLGAESRYRKELAEQVRHRHLGAGAADLESIFVPTSVVLPPAEPRPVSGAALPKHQLPYLWPELASQVAIEPPATLTLDQVVATVRRVALLAPPGGGKSTTLAYLALGGVAEAESVGQKDLPPRLPIYAHVAELELDREEQDDAEEREVELPLIEAFQGRSGDASAAAVQSLLKQRLADGRAVILLDGWDELAPVERPAYTQWLGELVARFAENQFIVSAPLAGYGPLVELGFAPLSLKSWGAEETIELAERWTAAMRPASKGESEEPTIDFWRPGMTPLDATMNLWLSMAGETPPAGRAQLYETSVRHLLQPFEEEGVNWPLEIGHDALDSLAAEMDRASSRMSSRSRLAATIGRFLRQRGGERGRVAQDCLHTLAESSGLLATWGEERLTFRTPAFYAYFRAHEIAASQVSPPAHPDSLDPEWSLRVALFIEMTSDSSFVEGLLAVPDDLHLDNLFLVASSLAGVAEDAAWKPALLVRLANMMADSTIHMALRERAAAALVGTGDKGISHLLRLAITETDPVLRALAAQGLGALADQRGGQPGDQQSLQALLNAMRKESTEVKAAVTHALAATGSRAAETAMVRALLEAAPEIKRPAAESLARMRGDGHQILQEALNEDDLAVRRAALHGLALIDEPWVDEKLQSVMREDKEWIVRSGAEEMLGKRRAEVPADAVGPIRADSLAWLAEWSTEKGAEVPEGPEAGALLVLVLQRSKEAAVRAAAARSLGDVADESFLKPLNVAYRDSSEEVREAAFYGLAKFGRAWNQRLPAE